jgi:hypothetical protein
MAMIKSFVSAEAKAVVTRLRLEDQLIGRPDLISSGKISASLISAIKSQLVAGVDYPGASLPGGLPAGARYTKLCFSDIIGRASELDVTPYRLPNTKDDLRIYYKDTLGLDDLGWAAVNNLLRIDFAFVESVRLLTVNSPLAWRLLLSHEFDLAVKELPSLERPMKDASWQAPIVDAFKVLAELERLILLVKRLATVNKAVNLPRLLEQIEATGPLYLMPSATTDEIYAFLERLLVSDIAIETFITGSAEFKELVPASFPLRQLARGELTEYDSAIFDNTFVRHYLIDAIMTGVPKGRGRPSHLDQVAPGTYWLISTEYVIGVGMDDILKTVGRSSRSVMNRGSDFLNRRTALVSYFLQFADPAQHLMIEARKKDNIPEWEYNWKRSQKLAKSFLPSKSHSGSAARFNPNLWTDRERDVAFWRLLQDPDAISNNALPELSVRLRKSLRLLQLQFAKLFSPAPTDLDVAARATAVLATSSSTLAGNRATAKALRGLLRDKDIQRLLASI